MHALNSFRCLGKERWKTEQTEGMKGDQIVFHFHLVFCIETLNPLLLPLLPSLLALRSSNLRDDCLSLNVSLIFTFSRVCPLLLSDFTDHHMILSYLL